MSLNRRRPRIRSRNSRLHGWADSYFSMSATSIDGSVDGVKYHQDRLVERGFGMFGNLSYGEMLIFGAFALLLFGSRLPEVARNLGRSYQELRKHINEFQREFQSYDRYEPPKKSSASNIDEPPPQSTAPKFTPPPADEE